MQLDALSALVLARPVHGHPGSQAEWVRSLEMRLAEQDRLIAQLSRLKQFVPRQIVDVVLSDDAEQLLKSHRREIVVVFVDLRGFTLFAETAAPEDLAEVLAQYHCDVGRAAAQFGGTLERFAGDGIMIFFNDPVPIAEPAVRAIQMALHLQAQLLALCAQWRNLGHRLDLGIGIAQGYATIGAIGFEDRRDYAAIGPVTNLANRLCGEAREGKIFVSQRVAHAIRAHAATEPLSDFAPRGILGQQTFYCATRAAPAAVAEAAMDQSCFEHTSSCRACAPLPRMSDFG